MDPLLNLNPIAPLKTLGQSESNATLGNYSGPSFKDLFQKAINEVEGDERTATQEARNLMTGQGTDLHSAILAVQKAEVSFNTMMAVRSKLIDAYREVMRMQM